MSKCKWIVREGKGFKYWAYTTCKRGFNPLTKVYTIQGVKDYYGGKLCPICNKPIELNLNLLGSEEKQ